MAILRPILFMQCNSSNLPLTDTDLMHILMSGTSQVHKDGCECQSMPSVRWHELLFISSWSVIYLFIYLFILKKLILYLARVHYDAIDQKVTFYDVPKKKKNLFPINAVLFARFQKRIYFKL